MKKSLCVALALCLILSMLAGCTGTSNNPATSNPDVSSPSVGDEIDAPKPTPPLVTIAFAVNAYIPQMIKTQKYFEEYLAKELNVNFIFSEELGNDPEVVLTFIENAYAAGADAIIDNATTTVSDVIIVAEKANDLGMYYTTWCSDVADKLSHLEYAIAAVESNDAYTRVQWAEMTNAVLGDGETHNLVLATIASRYGNTLHLNSAIGVLEAYQEMYGLTYEDELVNLCMLSSVTEIATGNPDVKITIFPSFSGDDLYEVLKDGSYDAVACVGDLYLRFETAISEIEKTYNMDIKLMVQTQIAESTGNSYKTLGPTGTPSLDAALLVTSGRASIMLALALNGVYGDRDAILIDGAPGVYNSPMWICLNAQEYELIGKVDAGADTYMFNIDEMKDLIKYYNDDVTADFFTARTLEYSSMESTFARRGII